jgi:undecaprenyl-diphosphatase
MATIIALFLLFLSLIAIRHEYLPWDAIILREVVGWSSLALDDILLTASFLGSINAILPLLGISLAFLAFRRHWVESLIVGATILAYPFYLGLKSLVGRPAPEATLVRQLYDRPIGYFLESTLWEKVVAQIPATTGVDGHPYDLMSVSSQAITRAIELGFPSGHALVSMVIYGLLAYLAWHHLGHPVLRWSAVGLLGALVFLIGLSRVYMGRHYPSDILAGWLLGALWLVAAASVVRKVRKDAFGPWDDH